MIRGENKVPGQLTAMGNRSHLEKTPDSSSTLGQDQRRWNTLKGCQDFYLEARARKWPRLSYLCRVCTAASGVGRCDLIAASIYDVCVVIFVEPEYLSKMPVRTTLELTRGNCRSLFLEFQGEYTLEVEIPGRGVRIL